MFVLLSLDGSQEVVEVSGFRFQIKTPMAGDFLSDTRNLTPETQTVLSTNA